MSEAFPSLNQVPRAFPIPAIPEDTLHYTIHPSPSTPSEELAPLASLITDYIDSLLPRPWIWNKDAWELKVALEDDSKPGQSSKGNQRVGKLEGRMRVGDSVDDEWLVVWLLREISKKWPELVISVRDTDGEFLLIEAANELPNWVSPDNADHRLWLVNGHLHLIPLSVRSSTRPQILPDDDGELANNPEVYLSEMDGLAAARTGRYRADDKMERAVWDRIASYPGAMRTHLHRTKAYLPVKIARALKKRPELVQRAVEAFYVRDPAQLRAAARMTHFPPTPAILAPVLLTRPAYAQLQGQTFHPSRSFGPEWSPATRPNDTGSADERRRRDLGVKIATGFEIMYREGGRRTRDGSGGKGDTVEDVQAEPGFERYMAGLRKADWFKGELEGSERWQERMTEAVRGWKRARSSETSTQQPSFAYLVDQAASQTELTPITELEAGPHDSEDSDSWLEISPDELDGMLARASGRQPGAEQREAVELNAEDGEALKEMARKVEDFVGGKGDMDGARFEDELSDDDASDDDDDGDMEVASVNKEARLRSLVQPLDDADWGQKPSHIGTASAGASKQTAESAALEAEDPPPKMRPSVLTKEEYDGVVDESSDEDDEGYDPSGMSGVRPGAGRARASAARIEELDEDGDPRREFGLGDNIDDEMYEAVWGGGENAPRIVDIDDADGGEAPEVGDVDMADEEEEFLQFSREMLGIDDEQWERMLADRKSRGAYVPGPSKKKATSSALSRPDRAQPRQSQIVQTDKGERDLSLDSFEKVMAAMESELSRSRPAPASAASATSATGAPAASYKRKADSPLPRQQIAQGGRQTIEQDLDDMSDDDLVAMDRELKAALKAAGVEDDGEEEEDEGQELGDEQQKREWKMMRDFLESYRAQGGESGVVGNLFGRLGGKR